MLRRKLAPRLKFRVTYEHDEGGFWVASIALVPGCHTQGRTIAQARQRIREALEVALERPDAAEVARNAELIDDVRLPGPVARKLAASRGARARAAAEEQRAQKVTRAAVRALVERAGLSMRDAADLLGLSHQRVQQLVAQAERSSAA